MSLFSNFSNKIRIRELIDKGSVLLKIILDPSFTENFCTHTFTRGEGVGRTPPISKTVVPVNVKFCGVLETFERLRNVKVAYIVITWLP